MQASVVEVAGEGENTPLPELRDDLGLFPGPRNARGEPSWTLHDPVRNRYFRIGPTEFEMLSRWQVAGSAVSLAALAARDGVVFSVADVLAFGEFLVRSELTQGDPGQVKRLSQSYRARQHAWWQKLLHNYLFVRIPLLRPDPWLDRLYPVVRPLLSRRFAQLTVCVGLVGLALVLRQLDIFLSTFMAFLSWQGAVAFGAALALVKVLHEGGHAVACRHFGLRVPTIGVALIVMWPVMYTDATEAWRLTSRRARIMIAAAGMLTELTIACYATLAWVLLPDGLLRSVMFTLATTTWIMSLMVNLNPLMKFDGYYLFSDVLDIPNLQDRGFALARNRLRHVLFGIPRVSDPGLLPGEQRIAIAWAYATWIYRFLLFLGIALLVYHFFFKALGIFLFAVEIWWFIAAPIWREVKGWRQLASALEPVRKRIALAGGAALLVLLLVPWNSSFLAPALMRAGESQRLYAVEPSRIHGMYVQNGQAVRRGDVLFELESPELDARIATVKAQVSQAEHDLDRVLSSIETAQDRLIAEEALSRARTELDGLDARLARQRIVAPFDGVLSDVAPAIRQGLWTSDRQSLGTVVGLGGGIVADGWISEDHLRFVKPGDEARFYPEDPTLAPVNGVVERVDAVDTRILPDAYLSETHGGGIPVRLGPGGEAIPENAVYRIRVRVADDTSTVPPRVVRGMVRLTGDTRSVVVRGWTFIVGTLRRESGF